MFQLFSMLFMCSNNFPIMFFVQTFYCPLKFILTNLLCIILCLICKW
ncbi:unnamed protein product [Schistosoma mattheei]|uniref:Uncharacterized protein n=1 Tax=Schistosoma mattheei TaxID=31246 RepID=A0A183PBM1_9TREM|nr:unnamed protein product [Schistosoma mattheei]